MIWEKKKTEVPQQLHHTVRLYPPSISSGILTDWRLHRGLSLYMDRIMSDYTEKAVGMENIVPLTL